MHSFKQQLHRVLLLFVLSSIWASTIAWANDRDSLQKAHIEASVKLINRAVTHNTLKARTVASNYLIDRLNYVSEDTKTKIEQLQDLLKKQTGKALYVIITRSPDMVEEPNAATRFNQETKDFTEKVYAQSMLDENTVLLTINFVKSIKGKKVGIKTSYLQSTGLSVGGSLAQHKITANDFRADLQNKATNVNTKDDYARALIYRVHQSLGNFAKEVALDNPSSELIAKYEEVLGVGNTGQTGAWASARVIEVSDNELVANLALTQETYDGVMTPSGKAISVSNMQKKSLQFWLSCNGSLKGFIGKNGKKYVALIRPANGTSCGSGAEFLGYYLKGLAAQHVKLSEQNPAKYPVWVKTGSKARLNPALFKPENWFPTQNIILEKNKRLRARKYRKPYLNSAYINSADMSGFWSLLKDLQVVKTVCYEDIYWNNVLATPSNRSNIKGAINPHHFDVQNSRTTVKQTGCDFDKLLASAQNTQPRLAAGWGMLLYFKYVKTAGIHKAKLIKFANLLTTTIGKNENLNLVNFEQKFDNTGAHHLGGSAYHIIQEILKEGYTSETELRRKYTTLPGKIRGAYSGKMYTVWATKTKKIPQGYNRYAKDYTGKSPKYQYSIQDLIVRHQYIANNHTILSPNIIKAEKAGKAFPLSSPEVKEQYKALFGTNSAIFAWAKYAAGSAGAVKDEFCFYLRGFADAVTSLIDSIEIKPHYWNPLCVKTKVGDCKACQYAYAPAFKNMFGMIEDQRLRTKLQEDFAFFAGVYNGMLGQLKGFTQMISLISGYFSDPKIRNQMAQAMNKLRKKGVWKLVKEEYSKATCNNFVTNYTQGKVLVDLLSIYVGAPKTINGFIEFTGKQLDNLTTKIAPTLTKLNLVTKKLSNKAIKLVKESGVFKIKKADKTLAQLNSEGKLEVTRALRTQPAGDLAALRARGEATQPIAARLPDGTEMNIVIYKQRTNAGEELVHCQPNGKRTCFVAGTLILTRTGYKKIEDIKVGDWVWSYHEQTGKQELKQVTQTFIRQTERLVYLYVGNELIQTTAEHPFYLEGKWVKAGNLSQGDSLHLFRSRRLALDSIAKVDTSAKVYNFSVTKHHNYFVGKAGVLVHNANGYDDLLARTNSQPLKDKINALGNDKAKFLDDFKDVDAVLAKFEAKPELVEGWRVLYDAKVADAIRTEPRWMRKVIDNLDEIEQAGGYAKWMKIGGRLDKIHIMNGDGLDVGRLFLNNGGNTTSRIYSFKTHKGFRPKVVSKNMGTAYVKDGVLHLNFNVPQAVKDLKVKGLGTKMFDDAFKNLEKHFIKFEARWTKNIELYKDYGGYSQNLKSYLENFAKSGDKVEAARSTFTGKIAERHGYKVVSVNDLDKTDVRVIFEKLD
ncbi:polymorphic toxin-type HINT domain-containing protein [Microscilla marina]|uniref:Intein C-terminal splicing region domain protein n=1 Tax=Microscilla marina ATCC 23134 TaxID=313606 RepID=A1ZEK5_MICM2|nr:polymorphic toxin-type HINT domain-containing protein [Microscilla marina]EAY30957.1 intein C-terminal splicing region domain protein [Microscilla marina ATCC 23134]